MALAAAFLTIGVRLIRATQHTSVTSISWLVSALLAVQAIWLWIEVSPSAQRLSIGHTAAMVAFAFAINSLIARRIPHGKPLAGLLLALAGISLVGSVFALLWFDQPVNASGHYGWPLIAHILFSVVAYTLCAIAAVIAILMVFKERQIRANQVRGIIGALPSLLTLEHVLFGALGIGFALLSLSMFSGLIFIDDIKAQHLIHKTILTALGWLVFGGLLLGRWRFGWRGQKAVRWTLTGFVFLALAYFGSRLVLEQVLGRSWG